MLIHPENKQYIPGGCNVGPTQIEKRIQLGWIGFVVTVGLWANFIMLHIAAPFRLLLFIPAAVSAVGFLEALMHFCIYFAFKGICNFGSKKSTADYIMLIAYSKKDRKKAYEILFYGFLIGSTVALLAYYSVR